MQCKTLSKMHPDPQLALRCWILYWINSVSVAIFCIDSILPSYVEGKIMRAFLQICAADQESFCLSVNANTNTNASINRNKNTNINTNTKQIEYKYKYKRHVCKSAQLIRKASACLQHLFLHSLLIPPILLGTQTHKYKKHTTHIARIHSATSILHQDPSFSIEFGNKLAYS